MPPQSAADLAVFAALQLAAPPPPVLPHAATTQPAQIGTVAKAMGRSRDVQRRDDLAVHAIDGGRDRVEADLELLVRPRHPCLSRLLELCLELRAVGDRVWRHPVERKA